MYNIFLKGLKVEIQAELSREKVKGLLNLMDATIKAEKIIQTLWKEYESKHQRSDWGGQGTPRTRGQYMKKTPYWMSSEADMTKKHTSELFSSGPSSSSFKKQDSAIDEAVSDRKRVVLTKHVL